MEQKTAQAQTQRKVKLLHYFFFGLMCIWHVRLLASTAFNCTCIFWLLACKFPVALSLLSDLLLWRRSFPSSSQVVNADPPVVGIALVASPGSSACLLWSSLGFFSVHRPSRVFQALCKSGRGWGTSHCFADKSLGLILVPKKVTNPVCLCAEGGAKLLIPQSIWENQVKSFKFSFKGIC